MQKIAIVDDAADNRDFLYYLLRDEYHVLTYACIKVWAVGCDGVAGESSILGKTKPFRGVVQVSGDALVAKVQAFRRKFQKYTEFHDAT